MAGNHHVRYLAGPARLAVIVAVAAAAHGQTRLTLRQTAEREPPAYTPRHAGERIVVSGVVSVLPVRILGYRRVYIQDSEGSGLAIDSADSILDGLRPGDAVEASGRLVNHMGLPVLRPESIRKSGTASVPVPLPATLQELNGFKRLGTLISIEENVVAPGENAGGDILILGKSPSTAINVFLPRESRSTGSELSEFRPGDRVRVTGVSSQYCPIPPHTRAFQVLIGSPQAVTLLARGWRVSSGSIFGTSLALVSAVVFWSIRERSLLRQRKRLRILTGLAEEAVGATSAADIQRRLNDGMPGVVSRSKTRLYLFNTLANALEAVPVAEAGEPAVVDPQEPADSISGAIALCFNNRTLLHIPDTAASPILSGENLREFPRSMLLAPMRASEEVLGVLLVMCFGNRHRFHVDEQTSLQHVANQVATSFKLQDQQSMREQLLRTEKMAAAGQLISRVADELRSPLTEISRIVNLMLSQNPAGLAEEELRKVAVEASRGSEIAGRLISFSRTAEVEPKTVDMHDLLNGVMEVRTPEWGRKGIHVRSTIPSQPAPVFAVQSQLEELFLSLLVHAEHALADSPGRLIAIDSSVAGKKVTMTIEYLDPHGTPVAADDWTEQTTGSGLEVGRIVIESHGGAIRYEKQSGLRSRFRIELPLQQSGRTEGSTIEQARAGRQLTVLVVEPDPASQRKLLSLLGGRGHRAVPVASAEEAADLTQRLRFDAIFCALRLPGLTWLELHDRSRKRVGAFVLLAEGHDAELPKAFRSGDGFVLNKPIQQAQAERLLADLEMKKNNSPGVLT